MKTLTKPNLFYSSVAQNSAVNSNPVDVSYLDNVGIQVNWSNGSGSPAGNIEVDGTIDGSTWVGITLSPVPAITGNSGSVLIQLTNFVYDKLRVRWQRSAGQVDLNKYFMAKSEGR